MDEKKGVWRTIRGRRVFIEEGQSLYDAMEKSGKFSKLKGSNTNLQKEAKDNARKQMEIDYANWEKSYMERDWNNENWRKENDELGKKRDASREAYQKMIKEYYATNKPSDWREQIEKNDLDRDVKLEQLQSKRGKGEYKYNDDRWLDDYYGTFRENEKRNAKIKKESPDEKYEYVEAYAGYKEKFNKHGDYDTWYGSEYTNDEFMEHLTDANWHTERKMIEEAGLTNAQLTKLKNQVKLGQWSADLDRERTRRLIDEVKGSNKSKGDKVREIKAQNSKVNEITKEEYDKMPKDYKGTLKEVIDTAEFRGENKEELKKMYEDMGYDVENDKTILKLTKGGTTLQPVKIKAYNEAEQDILDYFTEDFGWEGTTPEKAFVEQIDYMRNPNESDYAVGKRYAEGGSMLVYNKDMADYLNSRGVKATEDDAFEKYTDYVGRNIAKLYRELKKK